MFKTFDDWMYFTAWMSACSILCLAIMLFCIITDIGNIDYITGATIAYLMATVYGSNKMKKFTAIEGDK